MLSISTLSLRGSPMQSAHFGGRHRKDAMAVNKSGISHSIPVLPAYRTVWRWHFYAGIICIPFVLWLAVTGSIYLFKPQIDAFIDRPYANLTPSGPRASAHAQVAAALAAVPGGTLNAYQLPHSERSAVQILVGRGGNVTRVYVDPWTLAVLKAVDDDARFTPRLSHLHGELLLGDRGSMIVELAASWAIVMILTGLFLWWPRNVNGAGGVLYPRLGRDRRFWRDLHGVAGFLHRRSRCSFSSQACRGPRRGAACSRRSGSLASTP